jgi:hypothetical protein
VLADGHRSRVPLIDQYATSVQVRDAKRLGSGPTSVLYRPRSGALRLRPSPSARSTAGSASGAVRRVARRKGRKVSGRIVLRLSLPAGAQPVRMQFRSKSGAVRNLQVGGGTSRVVSLPACGTGPVEIAFAATSSGRLGDTRIVSVGSKPPTFEPDPQACTGGSGA